jgi:hypothetical protein
MLLDKLRLRLNAAAAMGRTGQRKTRQNEQGTEGTLAVDCENAAEILLVGLPARHLCKLVAYGFTKKLSASEADDDDMRASAFRTNSCLTERAV